MRVRADGIPLGTVMPRCTLGTLARVMFWLRDGGFHIQVSADHLGRGIRLVAGVRDSRTVSAYTHDLIRYGWVALHPQNRTVLNLCWARMEEDLEAHLRYSDHEDCRASVRTHAKNPPLREVAPP